MRQPLIHSGAEELSYEIREIVTLATAIARTGVTIYWENIGDPIAKGHTVPAWIKDLVQAAAAEDATYGYSPTRGLRAARDAIVQQRRAAGVQLRHDDILFFNGLGDAIAVLYEYLRPGARVIGPSPAYPTHASAEGAHAGSPHPTYPLDPARQWQPDVAALETIVAHDRSIVGILIINPDNPTGAVYTPEVLRRIVAIARRHQCFIIADEIYANIVYGTRFTALAEVIGDVPGIALRGLSKEVPWPGARCGWAEFYNTARDPDFARYAQAVHDAKMLEVCATTLPQAVLPRIFADARYAAHLRARAALYRRRAAEAVRILRTVPHIVVTMPQGGFYLTVLFTDTFLRHYAPPPAQNEVAAALVRRAAATARADERIVYHILAATGICVVPLTGFMTQVHGFRMTLLERDDATFTHICKTLATVLRRTV